MCKTKSLGSKNMGRKHKRQYRAEKPSSNEPPLKLVLKVGKDGASSSIAIPQESVLPPEKDPEIVTPESSKKKRRKKKKYEEKNNESDYGGSETVETEGTAEEDSESVKENEEEEQETVEEEEEESKPESSPGEEKFASMPFKKLYLNQPEKRGTPAQKGGKEKEVKIRGLGLDAKDPLTKVLESLHTSLEKKDLDKFFAHPVTDLIAPGYSTIIANPMDFSTMKKRIKDGKYITIEEYQEDFKLMCDNCMTYNQPETIYYKAAKKLLAAGQKIMGKERLAAVKRAFHYTEDLESRSKSRSRSVRRKGEVGASGRDAEEGSEVENMVTDDRDSIEEPSTKLGNPEGSDDLTDQEAQNVIQEVLQAAKEAKDRLTTKAPQSKMGFLRRDKDGTTTLNFVNPSNLAHPLDPKAVNMGMLTGKLSHGTGSIPGFREDKRNKANPITYLYYGPFSSYAPKYDSTYSNLSKEESDLLYSTYGDETGYQYAKSIQAYTKDCDNYVVKMVDSLLDTLTNGEHSKTMAVIEANHKEAQTSNAATAVETNKTAASVSESTNQPSVPVDSGNIPRQFQQPPPDFDLESLKSLSDLGIDMSFLPALAQDLRNQGIPISEEAQDISSQLNKTSDLIEQLEKTQTERLSRKPPANLQYVPEPTEQEYNIAEKLSSHLQKLISKATPGDIASPKSVRSAMGIRTHPVSDEEPITIPDDQLQDDIEIIDEPADPPISGPNKELLDLLDSPQEPKSEEVIEIS